MQEQILKLVSDIERQFDMTVKRFSENPSEARLMEYDVKMTLVRDYLGPDGEMKSLAAALLPETLTDSEVVTASDAGTDLADFAKDSILGGYQANVAMISYASKFRRAATALAKSAHTPEELTEIRERIRVGHAEAQADFIAALSGEAPAPEEPSDPLPEDPAPEGGA